MELPTVCHFEGRAFFSLFEFSNSIQRGQILASYSVWFHYENMRKL